MKVLVAGDFCPILRAEEPIISEDYQILFRDIKDIITNTDCSIVNLECPVININKTCYPIPKCGPNLKGHINSIKALKYAGFKLVTLANNHILDYGEDGLNETIETCENEGILYTGAGANLDLAGRVLYYTINGKILAIINCCEEEFSIAEDNKAGANPLNPVRQYYAIKEAKSKSDYIIVIVHGGHEHYQLPSTRMIDTYRYFIDVGADAVVNHHQHCYSGFEIYNNKPIFYGLGNFCFDHNIYRNEKWNEGYMVIINFDSKITYNIIPYKQNNEKVGISLLPDNAYDNSIEILNRIIAERTQCLCSFNEYVQSKEIFNDFIFEPYNNTILKKLFFRKLIPKLFPKKKKILFENMILCESHRDILLSYLKKMRICKKS